jgi:hypothetical protein
VGSEGEGARSPRSELQIEEHMDAQRIGWVIDRIGWITMLVVILTAVGVPACSGPTVIVSFGPTCAHR